MDLQLVSKSGNRWVFIEDEVRDGLLCFRFEKVKFTLKDRENVTLKLWRVPAYEFSAEWLKLTKDLGYKICP